MLRAERMKSLPRIVKEPDHGQDIKPYDFFAGFKIAEDPPEEDPEEEGVEEEAEEEEETISPEELERMVAEAEEKARKIVSDARQQADIGKARKKDTETEPARHMRNRDGFWMQKCRSWRII